MTNKDELLLNKFFDEQRQEIPDEDFSRQVMKKLPSRLQRYERIWSTICIIASLTLFVMCHGVKLIINSIEVFIRVAPTEDVFHYNFGSIFIAIIVLLGVGVYNLATAES